jgi:glycosyltransferase involved in cell wall biosynthesis
MCVYNGERFLLEQLESIFNQTCQPDEVIIYDDCSTDSSIDIINHFIIKNNLCSSWRINVNLFRKGWRLNFFDAIAECNGDYIFFCDQDDIWYPDKISIMVETMKKNPSILVLTGILETIDTNGYPISIKGWLTNNIYDCKIIKSNFGETIFIWKLKNGCTMAIKKIIKDQLKYFERNQNFEHDIWAHNIGSLLDGCYHINHPIIKFRVHEKNATAEPTSIMKNKIERILELDNKVKYLEYIYNGVRLMDNEIINKNEYYFFLKAIAFYKFKLNSIKKFKLTNIFRLIPYINIYFKYFSFKLFIIDILEILQIRDFVRIIKHFRKINIYK